MLKNLEELVIELGGGMGTSDHIEPMGVEACIYKSEFAMVYQQEVGLLLFMEGMTKHDENILMHFFNSWNDRKVNISGMSFKIMEEVIAKVGAFTLGGKNQWPD